MNIIITRSPETLSLILKHMLYFKRHVGVMFTWHSLCVCVCVRHVRVCVCGKRGEVGVVNAVGILSLAAMYYYAASGMDD